MGAVLVDEHPGFVQAVIGIAADMVPALQDQHPLPAPLCQLPGHCGPRKARADHHRVKLSHFVTSFSVVYSVM